MVKKKFIVFLIAFFLLSFMPFITDTSEATWYDYDWDYRKLITISSSITNTDLENFTFLYYNVSSSDLATYAQDDGDDILFVSYDDATKLSHELEYFNGISGEIVAWVKIPVVNASVDTLFWMYYGNTGATNQQDIHNTWDQYYVLVQHLNETDIDGGAGDIKDSSSYYNNGTTGGMDSGDQVAGAVDGSFDFDGGGDINCGEDASLNFTEEITLEAWFNWEGEMGSPDNLQNLINNGHWARNIRITEPDHYQYGGSRALAQFVINGSETRTYSSEHISPGTWYHFLATYNGTHVVVYINGSYSNSTAVTGSLVNAPDDAIIGVEDSLTYYFYGMIDEARISNIARNQDWITAQYNNMNDTDLYTDVEEPEEKPTYDPEITNPSPANNSVITELPSSWGATITDPNGDLFNWSIECSNGQSNSATHATNGTKSLSLSGLIWDTTHKVWVNVTDFAGNTTKEWFLFTPSTGAIQDISVYVAHPDPIDKDQEGHAGVIVANPTNDNVTVTSVYINTTATNDIYKILQGVGNSYPTSGWTESDQHIMWSGSEVIGAVNATGFWVTIDGNRKTETFDVNYSAVVDSVRYYSARNPFSQEALNGNLPFADLWFDTGVASPVYVLYDMAGEVKQFSIALEEHGDKQGIVSGTTMTIVLPPSFTNIVDVGGTGWDTANINGNTITVNTTQTIKNNYITYSFNATLPPALGLFVINITTSASNCRAILEGIVKTTYNYAPVQYNEYPTNGSTDVAIPTYLQITVDDFEDNPLDVYWYSNSSGSWELFGTNLSLDVSSGAVTLQQTNSNFSAELTTYYWRVNVTNGYGYSNKTYHFTYGKSHLPIITNPYPANGSTDVQPVVTLGISVNDSFAHDMDITWYSNYTGSWVMLGENITGVFNGTYYEIFPEFRIYNRTYYWQVKVVDDMGYTSYSGVYHFTTASSPELDRVCDGMMCIGDDNTYQYLGILGLFGVLSMAIVLKKKRNNENNL